jgi:peptidyl-prolyl cis-trans isomerase-like 3
MANNGPNTNKSQFFITYSKQTHLDTMYTIFGKVIDELETLDKLEKEPVGMRIILVLLKYLGKYNRPLNTVGIKSISIHANPIAEREYDDE